MLGSTPAKHSRLLLAAAFDAGIRHFDVAPMYGFGQAERLLAEALGRNLREVTITTKYGLTSPNLSIPRRLARTVLQPLPSLKRYLQHTPIPPSESPIEDATLPPLTAVAAQRSIDQSLRNLGVETIDLLLLHEATPNRLQNPSLLETLERNQTVGKIRQFGIGSTSARILACQQQRPSYCRFLQYEWNVFAAPQPSFEQHPRILHGSLTSGRTPNPVELDHLSDALNLDLRVPGILERLQLKASLLHNTGHVVLFSTRTVAKIKANVETAEDSSLDAPARALQVLARSGVCSPQADSYAHSVGIVS